MENMDDLIQKAKAIGHDEVPDPKFVQAEKIILDVLNSKPSRCFQTKELDALLRHEHILTPPSSILTRLAGQGEIERVGYGKYCAKFVPERQSLLQKIKLILQKIL